MSTPTKKAVKTPAKKKRAAKPKAAPWTPPKPHEWTDGTGRVLLLKQSELRDGRMLGHGGFEWPASGIVEDSRWDGEPTCDGGGFFGWAWGMGIGAGKALSFRDTAFLVLAADPADVVGEIGGEMKCKARRVEVLFAGSYGRAWELIAAGRHRLMTAMAEPGSPASATGDYGHASATGYSGHASATGDYGHASATGDYGHASATGNSGHASATGDYGHASATGDYGHASATGNSGHASATGNSGHASATGNYGHASATGNSGHASATGYSGHASATGNYGHASATGDYGHASATGYSGHASATGADAIAFARRRAKAGERGAIVLAYWDDEDERNRIVVAYVGEHGIKPDTWYEVRNGQIAEVVR